MVRLESKPLKTANDKILEQKNRANPRRGYTATEITKKKKAVTGG